jgi:hypothetical protein
LPQNKVQYINSLKNRKINYIFIGSSRVENSIVSNQIEKKTNKSTVNLGVRGLRLKDAICIVKLLNYNNVSYDKLFIQLDYSFNYESEFSKFFNFEILPYYNSTNFIIDEYIKSTNEKYLFYKYIPFYMYTQSDELIGFRKILSALFTSISNFEKYNGYEPLEGVSTRQSELIPSEVVKKNKDFVELNVLLKSLKTEVVYFSTPISIECSNQQYFDKLKKVVPSLKNFHNVIKNKEYFFDNLHLNNEGAQQFSDILIKELNL